MNRRIMLLGLAIAVTVPLVSCNNDNGVDLVGNWVRVSDFDGRARTKASAFVIDNVGYITGGYDGEDYYNDTWSYDATLNAWTQKADFPGVKRSSAVGFATNSYGYVGTGSSQTFEMIKKLFLIVNTSSFQEIKDRLSIRIIQRNSHISTVRIGTRKI